MIFVKLVSRIFVWRDFVLRLVRFEMMSILVKRNKQILNTSIGLVLLGFFIGVCWPPILQYLMKRELNVSPGSTGFNNWKKTPVPVYLDFYFFNWTNPEGFPKEKPQFTEMGPYRYYEERLKVNLTWNSNGTVTFRQVRRWFFKPEESAGNSSDLVTTVNTVALTAGYVVRDYGFLHQQSVSVAFAFTKQTLAVRKTVQEMLYDGYEDDLMSIAVHISPSLSVLSSPFDKFAWFYLRNGSHTADGWFNMDTGVQEMNRLGSMMSWNFSPQTRFYPGKCGSVDGSTGDMFPPGQKRNTDIKMFAIDLCRTLSFEYSSDDEVLGIKGYRYIGGPRFADTGEIDPQNACYCNGECAPAGLLNISMCRYGAPVFVSFPHFYQSYPGLLQDVGGLHPVKEKHEFYVVLEPVTGVPIDVGARLQINLLVQPIPYVGLYRKVPKIFMPVLWVDQRVSITEELAVPLRRLLLCRAWSPAVAVVLLLTGLVFLGLSFFVRTRTKKEVSCRPTPLIRSTLSH